MRPIIAALQQLCRLFTWISVGIISLLAFPMIYDVIMRTAKHPTIWAFEVTTYALIVATFLANAYALGSGNHFRVTFILKIYPAHALLFNRFAYGTTFLFGLVLFVAGWEYAYVAYAADQHSATLLSVPLYLPRAAIPLGAISLMAQALVNLLTNEYPETNEAPIAVAAE